MPQMILAGGTKEATRALSVEQFFDYLKSRTNEDAIATAAQAYSNIVWVYRCTNMRTQTVAGMPWTISDDKGNEIAWPLANQLPAILGRIELGLCAWGASYVLKQANQYGMKALQWLNPATMKPKVERAGIVGYTQRLSSVELAFQPEEIIYHTLYNLSDDLGVGIAPMQVALTAAGMAHNANRFVDKFFGNGAIPAVILTTDQAISDEEVKRVGDVWQRLFGGIRNAWRTAVLRSGLKPTIIGSPIKDLAIRPILEDARQQIAVAFGIPQTLIEDAANFATAREHKLSYYYETIFPECRLIEAGLNAQLFTPMGYHFEFAYNDVEAVQQDEVQKTTAIVQLLKAGIIDRNEAREQLGYEVTEIAEASQDVADAAEDIAEVTESIEKTVSEIPGKLAPAALKDLAKWRRKAARGGGGFDSAAIPGWLKAAVEFRLADPATKERAFDPAIKAFDRGGAEDGLNKRIAKTLKDYGDDIVKKALQGKPANTNELRDALLSILVTELAQIAADKLLADAAEIGVGVEYAKAVTDAAAWAKQYSFDLVKGIDETTQKGLQDIISQIADGKLSQEDAATLLEPLFGEARAESIAATETTRALTQATVMYRSELDERGIKTQERWLTAEDEMVCPECEPLDHTLEEDWRSAAPDGPPLHPNCRCATVIEVVEK